MLNSILLSVLCREQIILWFCNTVLWPQSIYSLSPDKSELKVEIYEKCFDLKFYNVTHPSSSYYVIGGSWKNKDYQPIKQMFLVSIFSPGRAASANHWECLSLIRPLQTPTQAFSEILKTWSRLKIAVIFQFTISRSVGDTQGYLFEYYLSYFFPFFIQWNKKYMYVCRLDFVVYQNWAV